MKKLELDKLKEYRMAVFLGSIHEGSDNSPGEQLIIPEINQIQNHYENLLTTLRECKDEVLLVSFGSAPSPLVTGEQQLPVYIQNIAQTKSVTILLIDMDFMHKTFFNKDKTYVEYFESRFSEQLIKKVGEECTYISTKGLNLTLKLFSCVLPAVNTSEPGDYFYSQLREAFVRILQKNGQVFIANHTQAYSLRFMPLVGNLYNDLKLKLPTQLRSNLQLYTQGGKTGKVTYYLDKLYDEKASAVFISQNQNRWKSGEVYYVCDTISDLTGLTDFNAKKAPSALVQHSLVTSSQPSQKKDESPVIEHSSTLTSTS